jgi:D-alanyl-D-alanine carboxypeptidase/D-alanyl-D-alanine-endopeptidase (penicillin-binding protein 4)
VRKRTLISGAVAVTAAGAITLASTMIAQAQETGSAALGQAIDAILNNPKLTDSQASIIVKDAVTGEVLYDHHGNQRAIPGSNNKIATVAGAFEVLGEDFTFATELIGTDRPVDGVIDGDLYLRGSGDPSMLIEDYQRLAADLADAGVSTVTGDLVADDTAFDDERHGEEWAWGDLQYSSAMEISALTIGSASADHLAGTVRVFVKPGAAQGDDAQISMTPANDYVEIVNEATTGATGSGTNVSIDRDEHSNTIRVTGTIAAGAAQTFGTRSVIEPTDLVASIFEDALEANGITVNGDVVSGETTPQGGQLLATHTSAPLSQLAVDLMKPSNNSYAEAFFKAVGAATTGEGTFESGQEGVYAAIEKYGVNTDPIRQVDGSGMSRFDEVTPDMVTDLLIGAREASWYDAWYASFPVACKDGTLASRMCGTPAAGNVHAKSGTLTSVSALSGYATDADGRELVFSILLNDHLADSVKSIEDQIGAAIAGHSESSTEAEINTFANIDEIEEAAEDGQEIPGDMECSWYEPAVC